MNGKILTVSAVVCVASGLSLTAPNRSATPRAAARGAETEHFNQRPECPVHRDSLFPPNPVSGPITNVPEFHDCQRFIVAAGYDSLYAIFASYKLDSLWRRDTAPTGARGFVAAAVVSWAGTYDPLGIRPGFNCLFLIGSPGNLTAKMVHYGPTQVDCRDPAVPRIAEKGLAVRRLTSAFFVTHYPPVARWEWDAVNQKQYAGLTCGRAWCEIYDPATTLSSAGSYQVSAALPPVRRRVTEIKGWFDEQRLAEPAAGPAPPQWAPSRVKGTVFPHPRLDSYTQAQFTGTWLVAAYVALSQPHPYYRSTFNFGGAPATAPLQLERLTTIELCRGSCPGVPQGLRDSCKWPADEPKPYFVWNRWWARITTPGIAPMYKCVIRRAHSDLVDEQGHPIRIPGTVRWRWMAGDETTWMKCDQGCCEVGP